MSKQREVEKRADGRLSAVGIIERINIEVYNQIVDAPRIYGSNGQLAEGARTKPLRDHMEAILAPDPETEEAPIYGIVTSLAWLADLSVTRTGHSIAHEVDPEDSPSAWFALLSATRRLLSYDRLETGRLIREAVVKMLDEMEKNERSEPYEAKV